MKEVTWTPSKGILTLLAPVRVEACSVSVAIFPRSGRGFASEFKLRINILDPSEATHSPADLAVRLCGVLGYHLRGEDCEHYGGEGDGDHLNRMVEPLSGPPVTAPLTICPVGDLAVNPVE